MDFRNPSRRDILAGLGATAFTPFASRLAIAQSIPTNPDVAIIGSGPAGLSAARTLAAAGKTFVVLEADDRKGGRAHTDTTTFPGIPFDRGCAWIHSADRNPMLPVAKQHGFTLQQHHDSIDHVWYGREKFTDTQIKSVKRIQDEIVKANSRVAKVRDGAVSEIRPIRSKEEQATATLMGPMDMAVDFHNLSIRDYDEQAELEPNYLVKEGFGTVVAKFGESVPVSLETPVQKIKYSGQGVQLETAKGTVSAKYAIVTCSTGALQSGYIKWDPVLPEWKETAIQNIPMALLAKIPLLLDGERFGIKPFEDILLEMPGKQDIYFICHPFDFPMMIGFVGGDFAWNLSSQGREAAIDFATSALQRVFGEKTGKHIIKSDFTQWPRNPWVRGAYSAALPGQFAARAALKRPLADKVYFAGEAVAGEFTQTCGGAVLVGAEVANTIIKRL
ncbi:MAG: FAD-dependent oxidoreductase [Xanthobacteraceae bacterium]|nr:FAD-dependent oxidoreductase [Xanthobacteraceae bacterium]